MGLTRESHDDSVSLIVDLVKEISGLPECNELFKKIHGDLVRRIKLLSPLFEELSDAVEEPREEEIRGFQSLGIVLDSAKELLQSVSCGSKLYQAMQKDIITAKVREVTAQIEAALGQIPYNKLNISEEVKEQVELVHAQFSRAKGRDDVPESQLDADLAVALNNRDPDPLVVQRLSDKLQLRTIDDVKKESVAIHELVISRNGDIDDCFEKMFCLLKRLKNNAVTEKAETDAAKASIGLLRHRSPLIPDEFLCPMSLELMKDPVIVSTGQTYERSCIQRWLDAGYTTCPKTQRVLDCTDLTPNYVLKSLITLWCESNGIELLKSESACSSTSDCDRMAIIASLEKLKDGDPEQQKTAAGELRLLSKRNSDNRVSIAEAGAIPLLTALLSSTDPRTQEHAVTALLNVSINDINKGKIVKEEAIPGIVDVLRSGSPQAKENAAAALFSLSAIDQNKVAIGAAGAIPELIKLLSEGSPRGKKDAATAIFNLCIYQGNRVRAVRSGIIATLMRLLKNVQDGMADEALAILAILSVHPEGKISINEAEPVPVLLEIIQSGSSRNRESAVAILWTLCTCDLRVLSLTKKLGGKDVLKELSENGNDRAKRKAGSILDLLQRFDECKCSNA